MKKKIAKLRFALLAFVPKVIDKELWVPLVAILIIGFVAHFLYFKQFGFFLDDWNAFLKLSLDFFPSIREKPFYLDQRPLLILSMEAHNLLFPAQSWYWGYLNPYLATSLSAFLFFMIARIRLPLPFALIGSILFIIYPSDTTHPWLAIGFMRIAMAISLLSVWLLHKKKYIASAVLLLCSGLINESAMLLYPFAILFLERQNIRRFVVIYGGVLATYLGWRLILLPWYTFDKQWKSLPGFNWNLTPQDIIIRLGYESLYINFITANQIAFHRAISQNGMPVIAKAIIVIVLVLLLAWAIARSSLHLSGVRKQFVVLDQTIALEVNSSTYHSIGLMTLGLMMVMYSYGFISVYVHSAQMHQVLGPYSRFHCPATTGVALTIASLLFFIYSTFKSIREHTFHKLIFVFSICLYLTILINFHIQVQLDYVRTWMLEKGFWYQLITDYSHLSDGTVVVIEIEDFEYHDYRQTSAAWPMVLGWVTSDAMKVLYLNNTLSSFLTWLVKPHEEGLEVLSDRGGPRVVPYSSVLWLQYDSQRLLLHQKKAITVGETLVNIANEHLTAASNPTRTVTVLDEIIMVSDIKKRRLFEQGKTWYETGQYDKAVDVFAQAIELAPDGSLYAWLGRAYQANNQPDQALATLEQAVPLLPPDNVNLYHFVGNTYRFLGKTEQAIDLYQQALAIAPDNLAVRADLARAYHAQGMDAEALHELQMMIVINPEHELAKQAQQILDKYH